MTQEEVKKEIHYEPLTGVFTWLSSKQGRNSKIAGATGSDHINGYYRIRISGERVAAHRLAFMYMTGSIPEYVDHIDRDARNNRWDNLRETTPTMNARNRNPKNRGIRLKGGRYEVSICRKYIGRYDTYEEALSIRLSHENKLRFGKGK